jgi:hypothetical protein
MVNDLENRLGISSNENARLGTVVNGLVGVQAENTALAGQLANTEAMVSNQQILNENLRRSMENVVVPAPIVPAPVYQAPIVPAPLYNNSLMASTLVGSRVNPMLYGSRVNPMLYGSSIRR